MKRKLGVFAIALVVLFAYSGINTAIAIQNVPQQNVVKPAPNARTIELAFVFDGPSDKNKEVMEVNILAFIATALFILVPTSFLLIIYVKTVSQNN